jgi:virginiamycin B lyase
MAIAAISWLTATQMRAAPQTSSDPYLIAYAIPYPGSNPQHIALESPARAWFTLPGIDAVGSLVITSTTDYQFSRFDLPAGSDPYDIAVGGGAVWFTMRGSNSIGRINIATPILSHNSEFASDGDYRVYLPIVTRPLIQNYIIPTPDSKPTGIAVAPDGMVWFAQENGNKLSRLDPASGFIEEYAYGTPNALFHDLTVQTNGIVWVAAPGVQRIVAFSEGEFFNLTTAATGSEARYLALQGGIPWISAENSNLIGRYAPGTLALWRWYTPPSPSSGLSDIAFTTYGGVNRTWVAQRHVNRILLIESTDGGAATFYWEEQLPTPGSQPAGLAVASNGNLWITAPGSNEIVVWSPPYLDLQSVHLPLIHR